MKLAIAIIWIFNLSLWTYIERGNLTKIVRRIRCLLLGHLLTTTNTSLNYGASTSCTLCRRGCGYCQTSTRNFDRLQRLYPHGSRVEFGFDGIPIITGFPPAASKSDVTTGVAAARNTKKD